MSHDIFYKLKGPKGKEYKVNTYMQLFILKYRHLAIIRIHSFIHYLIKYHGAKRRIEIFLQYSKLELQ